MYRTSWEVPILRIKQYCRLSDDGHRGGTQANDIFVSMTIGRVPCLQADFTPSAAPVIKVPLLKGLIRYGIGWGAFPLVGEALRFFLKSIWTLICNWAIRVAGVLRVGSHVSLFSTSDTMYFSLEMIPHITRENVLHFFFSFFSLYQIGFHFLALNCLPSSSSPSLCNYRDAIDTLLPMDG